MGVMPWADVGSNNYQNIDSGLKCKNNWNSCKPTYLNEFEENQL
jgi:hypothetical protein